MAPHKKPHAPSSRTIRDFFKPFTIPKNRRPSDDDLGEEIIVASSQKPTSSTSLDNISQSRHAELQSARRSPKVSPQKRPVELPSKHAVTPNRKLSQHSPHAYNINPLNGVAEITPTPDSPLQSGSPTPPSVRVLSVVAIPSSSVPSTHDTSPAPMVPPVLPPHSIAEATAQSFSSFSTLSSVPVSTQSSSKRIIKNGIGVVTNSDSGSDDNSDEDLPDMSTFFGSKRRKLSPSEDVASVTLLTRPEKSSIRPSNRITNTVSTQAFSRSPPPPKYKHSLMKIAAQNKKQTQSEAKIAEIESLVAAAQKQDEEETENHFSHIDDHMVAAATAGSDSDDRERMLQALGRTEALKNEQTFHFFLDEKPLFEDYSFPVDSLPDTPWAKIYREEQTRTQACISGFAAELAARYPLPMDVTNWMAKQLLHESREILCEAYIEILQVSCKHAKSISNTLAMLSCFFKTRSLADMAHNSQASAEPPQGLKYIMQVVGCSAPAADSIKSDAPPELTSFAFLDLALMNIDDSVRADISLSTCVSTCVEDVLDTLPEQAFQMLILHVVDGLFSSPELSDNTRCRVISSLPASTVRSYELRKRLARECFSAVPNREDAESQNWAKSIMKCLRQKPEFIISESSDYTLLKALVSVLDIAIADGFASQQLTNSLASPKPQGLFGRQHPPSDIEDKHNKQIDAITHHLQFIASRIRDAGTSHLKRTEAKDALERLIVRLENCVRTRPKPRKSVFGESQTTVTGFMNRKPAERDGFEVVSYHGRNDSADNDDDEL